MKVVKILIGACDIIMNTILILIVLVVGLFIYAEINEADYRFYERIVGDWYWDNEFYRVIHSENACFAVEPRVIDYSYDGKYIIVAQKPKSNYTLSDEFKYGHDSVYYWIFDASDSITKRNHPFKPGPYLYKEFIDKKKELGITVGFNRAIYPEQDPLCKKKVGDSIIIVSKFY